MIEDIQTLTGVSLRRICRVLKLPRSSYYQQLAPSSSRIRDRKLGELITRVFKDNQRRYGYRRIHSELGDQGMACSAARVRRLMKERGLRALTARKFVPVTSDGKANQPSPNQLLDQPVPNAPGKVWVGDITYIPTRRGWRYLAVVMDLCSRKIIGWSLADNLRSGLVCDALKQAITTRRRHHEIVFHSDQGSQYGSRAFRQVLHQFSFKQSMSRRANPYDNAWTESFMGTLKLECVNPSSFQDENDARKQLFNYIDGYYNTRRKHSSLGYLSPTKFESLIHQKLRA